jgi:predicted PurR-regulated permease PerM
MVWLLRYLSDVLIPFAIALLMAYLMNPLVVAVRKRFRHHAVAVFISLLLVGGVLSLLIWIAAPVIGKEFSHMGVVVSHVVNGSTFAERAGDLLPAHLWQTIREYAEKKEVQEFFTTENLLNIAHSAAQKLLPGVWGIIAGTATFVMGLVGLAIIGLYLIFLLLYYPKLSEGWKGLLPPAHRDSIAAFVYEFESAMGRYFRGQAAVASIVGALFATGFWIIGLPLGILLGLFIGVLNMVPYLQIIGLIPAFIMALFYALETGTELWVICGLTGAVFAAVQLIQDGILVPKIMGRVTGLNPAMILLSLSIWGKLLGLFGLLIGLPMTCLLLAYYRRFLATGGEAVPVDDVSAE